MRFSLLGMIVFATLLLAACQPKQQIIDTSEGISVSISGNTCPGVVVQAGKQVTWTNQDSREHLINHHPDEGDSQFSSGTLKPLDSFVFTFTEPGTYPYSCSIDGEERGTVIVEP